MTGTPTFEKLRDEARKQNWTFVDANFNDSHLTPERIRWALDAGRTDHNRNIRDFAITLLNRSESKISNADVLALKEQMMDRLEYHIVRYRCAVALYQRGNRDSEVVAMMEEASKDPDVGELAKNYLDKKN